jgi:DNA-binding MarR family transcriptional regulator
VLAKLQRAQGVKQCELADALDLAPITLARLVDKLTASGLVERRDDAADRRAHRLFLTEEAAPTLQRLGDLAEAVMARALAGLDDEAIAGLIAALQRIKTNLKNELTGGV